ncbi:MAG: PAS domain S-box protein [Anaerolineae bacterium]
MPSTKKCLKCDDDQVYTQTIAAPGLNNPDLWAGVASPWMLDMLVCGNCGYSELLLPAGIQSLMSELHKNRNHLQTERLELHHVQRELADLRRVHADLQARYQALTDEVLDSSKVGIFILDADFRIVWVNRAMEHYFGLNRAEIIGQDKRRLIHQKIKKIVKTPESFAERVLATYDHNTYIETFECQVVPGCACGEHWLEHWSQPIQAGQYAGGRVEHYYDITQRKRAEEALRETHTELENRIRERTQEFMAVKQKLGVEMGERERAEEQLRFQAKLLDSVRESIIATDLADQVTYWSKGAENLYGYRVEEVIGQFLPPFILEAEEVVQEKERCNQVLATGLWRGECRQKRKDDSHFWADTAISLVTDENGQPVGMIGIDRDITEQKHADETLRLTQYSIDNSPVGIGWIGPDGRLVYVNEGAGRMLGYSRDELLTMTVHDIDPKFSAADWPARWQELKERHAMIYESELQTKRGQIIPIEARINYLEFNGQEYLFVFAHNISRRKQAQELLQKSEERYRNLFEHSPISLWEEDFSAVKGYIDRLRVEGITDFRRYFEGHPNSVIECAAQVKVLDVNQAAVKIYQAQNKEDLRGRLGRFFASGAHAGFREELIALAEGKTTFEGERHLLRSRTLKGDKRYATLKWSVAPGCEETWSKVLVSVLDLTERKRAEEAVRLLQTITREISLAEDFHSALAIALRRVGEATGWDFGEAWIPHANGQVLECSPAWYSNSERLRPFRQLSTSFTFRPNVGLPGRVWPSKQSEWIQDVSIVSGAFFHRAHLAIEAGLKAGLGVPIIANNQVLAVLGFFMFESRPEDKRLIDLATTVAAQLGAVLQHKLAESEKNHLFEMVKQQHEQLRALTQRLAEIQEIERKQLAQELHDQVGPNLTALDFNLNIVKAQVAAALSGTGESIQTRLGDSLLLVEQTAERLRNVMAHLRPPMLDEQGLVATLRWYGAQFATRVGLSVMVYGTEPEPRLPAPVEEALFRITQEALTNVAKHARATQVMMKLVTGDRFVRLIIADNGFGFEPTQLSEAKRRHGWGLRTMAGRAETVGGCCRIESRHRQGTRVIIEAPRIIIGG